MTLTDKEVGWGQIAALVPEAVDKIKQFVGKKDGAKENAAEAADEATQ